VLLLRREAADTKSLIDIAMYRQARVEVVLHHVALFGSHTPVYALRSFTLITCRCTVSHVTWCPRTGHIAHHPLYSWHAHHTASHTSHSHHPLGHESSHSSSSLLLHHLLHHHHLLHLLHGVLL